MISRRLVPVVPVVRAPSTPPKTQLATQLSTNLLDIGPVCAIGYLNKENTFVSPSSYNCIGDFFVGNCILDTGCRSHLIAIKSAADLDSVFGFFEDHTIWPFFSIGRGLGTTGQSLTMVVRPADPSLTFPVRLATDICGEDAAVGCAKGYRFLLSGDDIRGILRSPEKLALFSSDHQTTLRNEQTSIVPRLSASLIGSTVLQQSLGIYFTNMAFFLSYQNLSDRKSVNLFLAYRQADQLHQQISSTSADIEDVRLDMHESYVEESSESSRDLV